MMVKENFKEALRSLIAARQRSILALIGIVIGIGSVIAMVSVGTIVQHEALRQFQEMGTDILTIGKDYAPSSQNKAIIKLQDALELTAHCPDVAVLAPYTSVYGPMSFQGHRETVPAMGVTEDFLDIFKLDLLQGRFISDLDENMPFCVIGPKIQDNMRQWGVENPIGQSLMFDNYFFTVIGVVGEVALGGMRPYEINEGFLIPITTAMRFPKRPEIQTMTARIDAQGNRLEAQDQILRYFQDRDQRLNLRITSAEELIERMQKQMQMFTLLLGAIGSISLIVGGVGVMNVMLVSVSERKKEIGIRRALGAQQADIQGQFLMESLVLSLVGGVIGIALGVGASYGISKFSDWEFLISSSAILLGVGVSAVVGVFFGFYPARQAARLNPIEALRSD
jgi:putative ABC transport system permease protein